MDIKERKIILEQSKLLLDQAKRLQNKGVKIFDDEGAVSYFLTLKLIDKLIQNFNEMVPKINILFKEEGLDQEIKQTLLIEPKWERVRGRKLEDTETPLFNVVFGTTTIVTLLDINSKISEENVDKLSSLSKELNSIKNEIEIAYSQNLTKAIEEFEKGAFLGSSLISGKVVRSAIDSIQGDDINEKIELFKKHGLVREKDGRDFLLKANHFSRNLTSHDINIFPTSSECISYLGDAIKIVKIISEYKKIVSK